MSTAALFTVAKKWQRPQRVSADEWIKGTCSTHTMRLFNHKKEQTPARATWMRLENMMHRTDPFM